MHLKVQMMSLYFVEQLRNAFAAQAANIKKLWTFRPQLFALSALFDFADQRENQKHRKICSNHRRTGRQRKRKG